MKGLYLECASGISGDMAVAALIDAGADTNALQAALDSILMSGFKTKISRVKKNGIDCADFNVILDGAHENHDHDMEYLFGKKSSDCGNGHHSGKEHFEHHDEAPSHSGQLNERHEHHEHRNLSDVISVIEKTKMTDGAKNLAKKIFQILAEAESRAHGVPLEEVHFHEVGAVDSIVDVIALSVCFESLHVEKVFVPVINEGTGTVRCQHGILPVPVPAVVNIASEYQFPLCIMDARGEFITPTGAAFAAAVMTDRILPEHFTIEKIGMGVGKRSYERPSILRAFIIEETEDFSSMNSDSVCKLETNIDDSTGEALGFVMEELLKNGALDVHFVPCFMKKNRPAQILCVLCKPSDREKIEKIIFEHTSTIGIRRSIMTRTVLSRKEIQLETPYGTVRAKEAEGNGVHRISPEYESVAQIARKTGRPFSEVYNEISSLVSKLKAEKNN